MGDSSTGAVGFPVNLPASFAPGMGAGGYTAPDKIPTMIQLSNQNNEPIPTLYIRGLRQKTRVPAMKKLLREKFSAHGEIVCIRVARTMTMKGQAFVSFASLESAIAAKEALDGQEIKGHRMIIQFAKAKSDKLAKKDGTFVKRDNSILAQEENEEEGNTAAMDTSNVVIPVEQDLEPHNILFVQNLPDDPATVSEIVGQYPGFVETRLVPGKPGMAFVEYSSIPEATVALKSLRSVKLPGDRQLIASFAKK
ncbi:hypothetical protein NDN08_006320 [Rhodosorus marinus]|uniref:RRM domain-containing protein n=1 Tax=Rhodosorus marinus TaxID=101924 RepID=A0AAV8UKF3_9RHOD|nr:hypothetical protein NDN08_006320 [Rhodosorus marinus]